MNKEYLKKFMLSLSAVLPFTIVLTIFNQLNFFSFISGATAMVIYQDRLERAEKK